MFDSPIVPGKICVISDTHLRAGQILPDSFTKKVAREDIIIHLGDFISPNIVGQIKALCRLEAVSGNCDPSAIRNDFPNEKLLNLNGLKIALTHGKGGYLETVKRVEREYAGKADVALFGHTHVPYHAKKKGTVFFNPGSLTQSRQGPESFGLMHLGGDGVWAEIFELR